MQISIAFLTGGDMQVKVIERTFRLVGENELFAQFTFITSGIIHIWFPTTGLQMEAHRNHIHIQDSTIIYTDHVQNLKRQAN